MRRLVSPFACSLLAASVLALAGCDTETGGLDLTPPPTEVAVDPLDFLGDTPCSSDAGAMRSYVISLSAYDAAEDTTPFLVGSSLAVPCSQIAAFRNVVIVGKFYTAEVDGYELPASQLTPFGASAETPLTGSREMVDAFGDPVSPRWTTRCGQAGEGAVEARINRSNRVRPCDPLLDASGSETKLRLDPQLFLSETPCSRFETFNVVSEEGDLPSNLGVPCDNAPLVYTVEPGANYALYATASDDDGTIASLCTATAKAGVVRSFSCAPATDQGSLRVSLAGLVDGDGAAVCPPGGSFEVTRDGVNQTGVPLSCSSAALISPLDAGLQLLDAHVIDANGKPFGKGASCGGDVIAGKSLDAVCVAND